MIKPFTFLVLGVALAQVTGLKIMGTQGSRAALNKDAPEEQPNIVFDDFEPEPEFPFYYMTDEENARLTTADDYVKVSISPLVGAEEQKVLFSDAMKEFSVAPNIDFPTLNGGLVMVHYHKTGHNFALQFQKILKDVLGFSAYHYKNHESSSLNHNGKTWDKFYNENLNVRPNTISVITNPSMAWNPPPDAPILYLYRESIDLVMSGYRYHGNKISAERWERPPLNVPRIDQKAYEAIFSSCKFQCSYFQLLNSVPEQEGVIFEALMERQELQNMVGNLQRWANNPQVLHITMKHLQKDFSATMKCITKFYGLDGNSHLLDKLFTLYRPPSDADRHVTDGKYDNTQLEMLLKKHLTWGPEFEKLTELSKSIYSRQEEMYGCPVPS